MLGMLIRILLSGITRWIASPIPALQVMQAVGADCLVGVFGRADGGIGVIAKRIAGRAKA